MPTVKTKQYCCTPFYRQKNTGHLMLLKKQSQMTSVFLISFTQFRNSRRRASMIQRCIIRLFAGIDRNTDPQVVIPFS